MVTAILNILAGIFDQLPQLIEQWLNDRKAAQLAAQMQQIQTDTRDLQAGPTTLEQKDAAAKALAQDTAQL